MEVLLRSMSYNKNAQREVLCALFQIILPTINMSVKVWETSHKNVIDSATQQTLNIILTCKQLQYSRCDVGEYK